MRRISSTTRISIALMFVTLSALFGADMLGLLPNRTRMELENRRYLCEMLAVSTAIAAERNDTDAMLTVLHTARQRNPRILSAAVRTKEGSILASVGHHGSNWSPPKDGKSDSTNILVPIYSGEELWGNVEIRMAPLSTSSWRGWLRGAAALFLFVCVAGFVGYRLILKRALYHLDPSKVVPDRVRQMLDALAEGILVLDSDDHIVLANERFCRHINQDADSLMGKKASSLPWILPDNADLDRLPWKRAYREQVTIRSGRLQVQGEDEKIRTFMVNAAPIHRNDGKVRGVLATFDDVSHVEEKNVQLATALERLKESRRQIKKQNRQLDRATKAAQAANNAKSAFLANMSHEIRTPLTAILGFAELLRDTSDHQPRQQEWAQAIHRNGEHLLTILNDVLDLSKIEAGKMTVERIDCSVLTVLRDVHDLMSVKAQEKELELRLEFDGLLPDPVRTDPTRLRQILMNLTGNALKFTDHGDVTIRTSLQEPHGRGVLEFQIIDTGIGMTQDQIGRLFQAFSQADVSTARKFGGTGLGLNISKQLASLLGGTITIQSTPGEGSTFTVTVDIGESAGRTMLDPNSEDVWTKPSVNRTPAHKRRYHGRILLAEDRPDNQVLISTLLERVGLTVDVVSNGREAMEREARARTDGRPYDMILMDMMMPEMDGVEATGRLRTAGVTTPIVALTANAMRGVREECLAAGFSDYAVKPIEREALFVILETYLDNEEIPQEDSSNQDKSAATSEHATPSEAGSELAAKGTDADILDIPAAILSMENDAELFLQVAGLFAENVAPLMDSISEAIRNGEPDALRSSAHGLKGSAGTIRATKVFRTAKQLEDMAKSYDLSQAPTAWKDLQHEVQRLLDYLATLTPEGVENASHSG